MDARAKLVRDILHSGDQFVVPFFQRQYSWKKEHWARLWNDIVNLLDEPQPTQHFLGPLVCTPLNHMPGEVTAYQLIDGQQRLTTLSLLLAAIRELALVYDQNELAEQIHEDYLIHKRMHDVQRCKIVPRFADRDAYLALIEGKDTEKYESKGVGKAYSFFKDEIAEHTAADLATRLPALFHTVVGRLSLVVITLDGENAYEIFESLNATGLPLEESDLIRNYLFMQVSVEEQNRFNEQVWLPFENVFEKAADTEKGELTDFYRDYLMREGHYTKQNRTYEDFKQQNRDRHLSPTDQVNELRQFATLEQMMRSPLTAPSTLVEVLRRLQMLDASTANPLVLHLLYRFTQGQLAAESLHLILTDLESFLLRRSICGESTRPYGKWFPEAIRAIQGNPRDDLATYWAKRGWPDDEHFVSSLTEFPIFRREHRKAGLILQAVEQSFGHKEKVELSSLTVEHVLPQSIRRDRRGLTWIEMLGENWGEVHDKWLHTIGNLTLTGYNSPLGNKSFPEKREILSQSKLELNRDLAKCQRWSHVEIEKRGRQLAEKAATIWPRPAELPRYEPTAGAEELLLDREKRGDIRYAYWEGLLARIRQLGKLPKTPDPCRQGYLAFDVGWEDAKLFAYIDVWAPALGGYLRCRNVKSRPVWSRIAADEPKLEAGLHMPLRLTHDEESDMSWLVATMPGHNYVNRQGWDQQHALQADLLVRLYEALREYFA